MPATSRLALADIISPVSPQEFLQHYWEQKHLVIQRQDPEFYGPIMKAEDIDRWFYLAKKSGEQIGIVPPPGSNLPGGYSTPRDASIKELYQAFEAGCSIALQNAHEYWLPMQPLVQALSEALSAPITVNVYFTPPGKQGVHIHPDIRDVFVLQLDGTKEWFMYPPGYMLPTKTITHWDELSERYQADFATYKDKAPEDLETLDRFVVEQGDFLYIPRGLPHCARSPEDSPSLHLAIQIHSLCWVDLMKAAVEAVSVDHIELRKALEPGFLHNADARARIAERFRAALDLIVGNASFDRSFEAVSSRETSRQKLPPDGHFRDIIDLPRLNAESIVVRRRGLTPRIVESDKFHILQFGETQFRAPSRIAPALRFIVDKRRIRVCDLEGLPDDKSRLVLIRRLIRDGLFTIEELNAPAFEEGAALSTAETEG
ncbi:MAG: cupin domain-containing protein [Acidobacteriota bacterium]